MDFQLRGQAGRALVRYGVNESPTRWGYQYLGLDPLVEVSRGFPVVQAEVEYPAEGYGAVLAWIQVIRSTDMDKGEHREDVDKAPQLEGLDLPYYSFGPRPVLFDAPSTTSQNMIWDATALLVVSPDCVMSRKVYGLCGFTWGYRVKQGRPELVPASPLDGADDWGDDFRFLRSQHPSWTFQDG